MSRHWFARWSRAVARGIPVVLIDSTVNTDKPTSVIATDNYAAGAQAAEALIAAMGPTHKHGGKVIMLRYLEGSGSTEAREKGFAERIKKEPGLSLVSDMYTKGQGTTSDAADTADALLRRNTKDNLLDADGIFASNQPAALGMLATLDKHRASGDIIDAAFVGFDAHDVLLKGVRDGKIAALVVQDPTQMGYLGVKTMVKVLNGQSVDKSVVTPRRDSDQSEYRRARHQDRDVAEVVGPLEDRGWRIEDTGCDLPVALFSVVAAATTPERRQNP